MSNAFKAFLSILFIQLLSPFVVEAGIEARSGDPSPAYWKSMINSLPPEDIPEAVMKDKDIGDSDAANLFKKAIISFKDKDYEKSLDQLKDVVKRFPADDVAQLAKFLMSDCYSRMVLEKDRKYLDESISQYLDAVRSYPASDEAPRGLYQIGRGLFTKKFYYEAIGQLDRIAAKYPKSEYVYKGTVAKGIVYFYQKKYSAAESIFRKIVNSDGARDEDRNAARLWLANTLHLIGKYPEAKELYKKFEVKSSDDMKKYTSSVLFMGENFMNIGEYGNASAVFQGFIKMYGGFSATADVMLRAADAARLEGKNKEALGAYAKVVSSYPTTEAALIGKARIAQAEIENGRTESASKLLDELLSLQKAIAWDGCLIIADALKKNGFSSDAAKVYRTLIDRKVSVPGRSLKTDMSDSIKESIGALFGKGEYAAVLKLYHDESRFFKDSRDFELLRIIAKSYLEVDLPSESAGIYDRLVPAISSKSNILPDKLREGTLFSASDAYLRAGRKADAERTIKRLLAEFPKTGFKGALNKMLNEAKGQVVQDESASGYISAAMVNLSEKRYKEAVELYNKAIHLKDPLFLAQAYTGLGDAYFGMGKYKEAITAYETGKSAGGEKGAWAAYRIGAGYMNIGDLEKAEEIFKSLATSDKGLMGRMAAEELRNIDMRKKNPGRIE